MVQLARGVDQAGGNVVRFEVGVRGEDLRGRLAGGEQLEHVDDAHTKPANAGATAALLGIDRDSLEPLVHELSVASYDAADRAIPSGFAHPKLDPATSHAGCYLRVADVTSLYRAFEAAALPRRGIPRMDALERKPWGMLEFAVVDPDGNLLRIGQVL